MDVQALTLSAGTMLMGGMAFLWWHDRDTYRPVGRYVLYLALGAIVAAQVFDRGYAEGAAAQWISAARESSQREYATWKATDAAIREIAKNSALLESEKLALIHAIPGFESGLASVENRASPVWLTVLLSFLAFEQIALLAIKPRVSSRRSSE
jgi:hypothetical protein